MVNLNFKDKTFKIVKKFFIFLSISLILIIAGFVDMAFRGMNIGIEFSAGATIQISVKNVDNFDNDAFKSRYEAWLKGDRNNDGKTDDNALEYRTSNTQISTTSGVTTFEFRIGTKVKENGAEVDLTEIIDGEAKLNSYVEKIHEEIRKDAVAYVNGLYPSMEITETSGEVEVNTHTINNDVMMYTIRTAFIAVAVAIVAILIYIAIRFTLISGLSAILALCHDVLVMVALTTIFQIPVNSTFIAAVITIIGYSINSTIVIFDRIREVEKMPSMAIESDEKIADASIANTMSRSILTTLTTLVMIVLLAIFGTTSIREFAYPIVFGLIAGSYSSVLLSAPLWVYLRKLFHQSGKRPTAKKSLKKTTQAQEPAVENA